MDRETPRLCARGHYRRCCWIFDRVLVRLSPEVVEAYKAMPIPVLKADFFRYLVLLARGGIYSDIDTRALKTTGAWLPEEYDRSQVGIIIGIEADPDRPDWADWYSRRIQFCQWTIQSKPGHPILRDIVASITEDALTMKQQRVLKLGKMTKSIMGIHWACCVDRRHLPILQQRGLL